MQLKSLSTRNTKRTKHYKLLSYMLVDIHMWKEYPIFTLKSCNLIMDGYTNGNCLLC